MAAGHPAKWVVATVIGIAALLAPLAARLFAYLDVLIALPLLGPTRTEKLDDRVLSLSRSRAGVLQATDAERRRIERDLHDGAQQRLTSLAMNLGIAKATLVDLPEPAARAIADAHDDAKQALAELRTLVRGLHPAVLEDRGLDAALSGVIARLPIPASLDVDLPSRQSEAVEAIAYFVVSEALTNVVKHSRASFVQVVVTSDGAWLTIRVTDDGRGGADPGRGSGLTGLTQRVAAVDGRLLVDSPPGGPTHLLVEIPCGT